MIGVQIVNQLHLLLSQKINPVEPAVAAFTTFNSGVVQNAIPSEATISGTIRTFSPTEREKVEEYFKNIIKNVTVTYGATYELDYYQRLSSII